MNDRMIC